MCHQTPKWILGIGKTDTKAKILADKLRHLQKARHNALPDIIDYGFDEEQQTFAIVYELLEDVQTFENKIFELKTQGALSGLIDLADCLQELHSKYKIHQADIHPSNILIDKNGQFYLIDFGLADITKTLSQTKELEIFARGFAAPEKLNKLANKGFPFQSDIFSMGKVIEWFYDENQQDIAEELNIQLRKLLAETPADRPSWQQVLDFLKNLAVTSETESVQVAFRSGYIDGLLELLNSANPIFDVSPKRGQNYLVDIIIRDYLYEGVIWLKEEDKLLFNGVKALTQIDPKILERKRRDGKKLPFKFSYTTEYSSNKYHEWVCYQGVVGSNPVLPTF